MINKILAFLYCVVVPTCSVAQQKDHTPYYISINAADSKHVHKITDNVLSVQYFDGHGKWKSIPLHVYDWKRSLVTTINMDKALGLNSFVINLKDIYGGWEQEKLYMFELNDEVGRRYELPVMLVAPPEKAEPFVNIIVNPVHMECGELSQNVVEFYGEIKDGKAPYTVNWFVLNEPRTDFLYQPREKILAKSGKTMMITVDKDPEYSVMLHVKDACGNTQWQTVNLTCEKDRKKINTIFVEEKSLPRNNTSNKIQ